MLRDCNVFYEQFKAIGSLGPRHGNIMALGADSNLIVYNGLWFCVRPASFEGPVSKFGRLEVLSTWCHVGCHVDFLSLGISLVPRALKILGKVTLDPLWLFDQPYNLYIMEQGPLSSSSGPNISTFHII